VFPLLAFFTSYFSIYARFKAVSGATSETRGKANVERAVAYVRVGGHELAGQGLDSQRERVTEYAHRESIWLLAVYEDVGVSGSTPLAARAGLSQALDVVRERFQLRLGPLSHHPLHAPRTQLEPALAGS